MARIEDLQTPALLVDADALEHNLATMAGAHPGKRLRPHVKAHKCTSLAARQAAHGHTTFTCATIREVEGMARAGLGDDLLLANEVLDTTRLAGAPLDLLLELALADPRGLADALADVSRELAALGEALRDGDIARVRAFFERAARARRALDGS